jgi:Zn ribbon nucleic-acid-binding protein
MRSNSHYEEVRDIDNVEEFNQDEINDCEPDPEPDPDIDAVFKHNEYVTALQAKSSRNLGENGLHGEEEDQDNYYDENENNKEDFNQYFNQNHTLNVGISMPSRSLAISVPNSSSNLSRDKTQHMTLKNQPSKTLNNGRSRVNLTGNVKNNIEKVELTSSTLKSVPNTDNHYERQYACKRCDFFTNNPRAVLYHRKEYHMEKINVHECSYCQYASQYSGKVERHTLLRHKIDVTALPNSQTLAARKKIPADIPSVSISSASFKLHSNANNQNGSQHQKHQQQQQQQQKQQLHQQQRQPDPLNTSYTSCNSKYKCTKCSCKYKRSSDLYKHLKSKHGILLTDISEYLIEGVLNGARSKNFNSHASPPSSTFSSHSSSVSLSSPNNRLYEINNPDENENYNENEDENENDCEQSHNIDNENDNNDDDNNDSLNKQEDQMFEQTVGSIECPYCTYRSNDNDNDYIEHVKEHLQGKAFRCTICNSIYKYRGDCVVHLKRKHQKADMIAQNYVERFDLHSCRNILQIYNMLKPNVSEEPENEQKLFGCSYCSYKANYKGDVYKHQTRRHPGTVKSVLSLNNSYNYAHGQYSPRASSLTATPTSNNNNLKLPLSNFSSGRNSMNKIDKKNLSNDNRAYDKVCKSEQNATTTSSKILAKSRANDALNSENSFKHENLEDEYEEPVVHKQNTSSSKKLNTEYDENEQEHDIYGNHHGYDDENNNEADQNNEHFMESNYDISENNCETSMIPSANNEDEYYEDYNGDEDNANDYEDTSDAQIDHRVSISSTTISSLSRLKSIGFSRPTSGLSRYQCRICMFVAKNHAKLQLHLATHYNLKPFVCPICHRRANFKWDIQKHLRKIHNDYTSEVICLSESDARQSVSSYMDKKQLSNIANNNNSVIVYENSPDKLYAVQSQQQQQRYGIMPKSNEEEPIVSNKSDHSASSTAASRKFHNELKSEANEKSHSSFKLSMHHHLNLSKHALRERKFQCPLCHRTSKWQWDIKKHMRTVHKDDSNEVIVLKDKELIKKLTENYNRQSYFNNSPILNSHNSKDVTSHNLNRSLPSISSNRFEKNYGNNNRTQLSTNNANTKFHHGTASNAHSKISSSSLFKNSILTSRMILEKNKHQQHRPQTSNSRGQSNVGIISKGMIASCSIASSGADLTGNKKFKCSFCSHRSNWKADLFRHIKRKHNISQPSMEHVVVLDAIVAASTIDEYEQAHSILMRKRTRVEANVDSDSAASNFNEDQTHAHSLRSHLHTFKKLKKDSEDVLEEKHVALDENSMPAREYTELNIKPFKCMKCGFRSNRKSDVVRHMRLKHLLLQHMIQNKWLKVLSIKEASQTIDQYEAIRNNNCLKSQQISSNEQQEQHKQNRTSSNHSNIIEANCHNLQNGSLSRSLHKSNTENNELVNTATSSSTGNDYYKCPFCSYKHVNKLPMRRHLLIHFRPDLHPNYRCSICTFKSKWRHLVRKHISTSHLKSPNAIVLKYYGNKLIGKSIVKSHLAICKNNPQLQNQHKQQTINEHDFDSSHSNSNYLSDQESYYDDEDHNEQYIYNEDDGYTNQSDVQIEDNERSYDGIEITNKNNKVPKHKANGIESQTTKVSNYDGEDDENDEACNENLNDIQRENKNSANSINASFNLNSTNNDEAKDSLVSESIVLTDYNGKQFTATFLVSYSAPLNSSNNANQVGKKMYYCESCPYKTNNYCNLKQHLLQHRFREGYFKCRYCSYYVVLLRLLKQHEILHPEYLARDTPKKK